ncbi:hypothetical protein GUITHDRAFT_100399 [Guillardia theta CCMP2712]|uniref:Uncharacterized protein n=1 Tax=Guillardia theta (strain CCMP2712) TaxID=905079 RepID=L1K0L2_GUITC|nr:hypothetical protein GUITHDRAFT_100399 [Guillardia theta CCMP2712]EKX54152.1 hypothetical protein GUITHDRAFT_100399 [Guillardia theta CCMP2712]|eukprot:XP_005841132.1 hypothetical protein GUITHDRAFT_100399 [Guillardia theta CCMP2712]
MPKLYQGDSEEDGNHSSISNRYSGDLGEALRYENATETIRRLQYEMQLWKSGKSLTSDEEERSDALKGHADARADRTARREQEKKAAYAKIQETKRRAQAMREKISTIRSSMSPGMPPPLSTSMLSNSGKKREDAMEEHLTRHLDDSPEEDERWKDSGKRTAGINSYKARQPSTSPDSQGRAQPDHDVDSIDNYLKPRKHRGETNREDKWAASTRSNRGQTSSRFGEEEAQNESQRVNKTRDTASPGDGNSPLPSGSRALHTAVQSRKPPTSPKAGGAGGGRRSMSPREAPTKLPEREERRRSEEQDEEERLRLQERSYREMRSRQAAGGGDPEARAGGAGGGRRSMSPREAPTKLPERLLEGAGERRYEEEQEMVEEGWNLNARREMGRVAREMAELEDKKSKVDSLVPLELRRSVSPKDDGEAQEERMSQEELGLEAEGEERVGKGLEERDAGPDDSSSRKGLHTFLGGWFPNPFRGRNSRSSRGQENAVVNDDQNERSVLGSKEEGRKEEGRKEEEDLFGHPQPMDQSSLPEVNQSRADLGCTLGEISAIAMQKTPASSDSNSPESMREEVNRRQEGLSTRAALFPSHPVLMSRRKAKGDEERNGKQEQEQQEQEQQEQEQDATDLSDRKGPSARRRTIPSGLPKVSHAPARQVTMTERNGHEGWEVAGIEKLRAREEDVLSQLRQENERLKEENSKFKADLSALCSHSKMKELKEQAAMKRQVATDDAENSDKRAGGAAESRAEETARADQGPDIDNRASTSSK